MIKMRFTLLWVFAFLISLASFAQQNPSVTSATISPIPVASVGAPYSITFTLGNNGSTPISGVGTSYQNRMQFSITLGKSEPNPIPTSSTDLSALSGPILAYFDITYNASSHTYNAQQKATTPATAISGEYTLMLNATVSKYSSTTNNGGDIGAALNIAPNGTSIGPYDPSTGNGGNNPNDDFISVYTHTTALPVSLVDFVAQAQENRTVLINWTTSWERANKGYIVERSKDLKSFEQVGEVNDVAGTSNSINNYKFVDATPYRGTSYYRLRQLDLDGSIHTYDAKSVVIDGRYNVYPNPVVNHQFTLELDEPTTAVIRLFNVSGNELGLGKSDVTEMNTKITPSTKLTTGVYVLTVEERGTIRKHRLVVQ